MRRQHRCSRAKYAIVFDIFVIVHYRLAPAAFVCFRQCQRHISAHFCDVSKRMQDFPVAIIVGPCRPPRCILNTEGEAIPAVSLNDIANRMRYSPSSPACFRTPEEFLEGFSRLFRHYVTGVKSVGGGLWLPCAAWADEKVGNVDKDDDDDDGDDDEKECENRPSHQEERRQTRGEGGVLSSSWQDLSSRRRVSWVAGRGSISDTPDRSLCRRGPVSSPSPCSHRSRPEIISMVHFFFYPYLCSGQRDNS